MSGECDGGISLDQVNVQPDQYQIGFDTITTQPMPASEIDTAKEEEEEKEAKRREEEEKKKRKEDEDDTCDSCYDSDWEGICELTCCVCHLCLACCGDDDD